MTGLDPSTPAFDPGLSCARRRSGVFPHAFTLIEIMVVIAVIALLLAILLPAVSRARQAGQGAVCLSNLRQFASAAHVYTYEQSGRYPIAQYMATEGHLMIWYKWDFTTIKDKQQRRFITQPGLLWAGKAPERIQQCPSFNGGANAPGSDTNAQGRPTERYTGYNYNTSYVGHGEGENPRQEPASVQEIHRPAACVLFGDGEYSAGANKFMRAPWDDVHHGGDDFDGRSAGTQGYRHLGRTNVAWCDGHAVSWADLYTETEQAEQELIAPGTGFLSPDNRLYDLD